MWRSCSHSSVKGGCVLAWRRFVEFGPRDVTAAAACANAAERLRDLFSAVRGGLGGFLDDGPLHHPQFAMLAADIRQLCADSGTPAVAARGGQAAFRAVNDRLRGYF